MIQHSSRRKFLKNMVTVGGCLCAPSLLTRNSLFTGNLFAEEEVTSKPKVIQARDMKFINALGKADERRITPVINKAVMNITNKQKPADAWSTLFTKNDIVGIKVNCLAGKRFSPHVEIIESLIKGVTSAGVHEQNIIVFERFSKELDRAGFNIRKGKSGVKCYGTDELPYGGYDKQPQIAGNIGSCFSQIISSYCTAIINVPILKDHDLAGVSIGMKNFFGVIHNPNKYHDNNCNPYVADLSNHPYIRDKLRLIVCDALKVQYNGGPAFKPQWSSNYGGLLISNDPVALDRIGAQIIEEKRKEVGLPSLKSAGREPTYITTAAQLGLGIDDPALIDTISI
ncbi:MAG: DUF362 domain-containing protein [Candidatus Scalindua sp. AMX11]|nr:MAG: DUF362 domain-containing protein [Candidatus Scalindua sp.]NOG84037.1 DUF362 domain-containing protein [Planctomycetota bacterium]RZV88104.1 MAG: DUF362 domain-containing protein [Candidatus Scalindua sp. SCAELEC01]TDE64039.1 MAG: DUF362 domain-containing protein [Candidatus Scalindua sp. AMX11]GJQ60909.1 MAG: hypothetical protein SCALA701_37100 [Candidatus Scalindua sp.]